MAAPTATCALSRDRLAVRPGASAATMDGPLAHITHVSRSNTWVARYLLTWIEPLQFSKPASRRPFSAATSSARPSRAWERRLSSCWPLCSKSSLLPASALCLLCATRASWHSRSRTNTPASRSTFPTSRPASLRRHSHHQGRRDAQEQGHPSQHHRWHPRPT